jgi:16S rRNA (adenine1518-N6/adenine1519-N6)-dimethyltransferase
MTLDIDNPAILWRMYRQRAKKHFGQHFLVHQDILESLIEAAGVESDDCVWEIGPGCGTLTWTLLQRGAKVWAFEVDRDAIAFLERVFADEPDLHLEEGDVLERDLEAWFEARDQEATWRSVANLPYNAATEIFFETAPFLDRFERLVWMFQREVAERFVADVGDDAYGVLSLTGRLHADPEIVKRLNPGAFQPRPQVHSAALRLDPIPGTRIEDEEVRETFVEVVRTAFRGRRKILPNALAPLDVSDETIEAALESAGLERTLRPESVGFEDYRALAECLSPGSGDDTLQEG